MQLPPTIISLDKGKAAKKAPSSPDSKPSGNSGAKKSTAPVTDQPKAPEVEAESGVEDAHSDEDEGDPELAVDPEEPLGSTPQNLRKTGSKAVPRPPNTLETTLFERLEKMYGPGIKRMLTVQYRFGNISLAEL